MKPESIYTQGEGNHALHAYDRNGRLQISRLKAATLSRKALALWSDQRQTLSYCHFSADKKNYRSKLRSAADSLETTSHS